MTRPSLLAGIVAAGTLLSLVPSSQAGAAGPGAFIWDGDYWGFTYDDFEAGLAAGGADPVERALGLPADLSPYRLVVAVLPKVAPTAGEAAALADFVASGGALVLVSDYDGYAPEPSDIFNDLLPQLGVAGRFASGTVYGCTSEAQIAEHPLTTGLAGFHSAAPDFVVPGPETQVVVSAGGQPILAVERSVVLLADSNPINTYVCSPAETNAPFYANLAAFACDVDGDGAKSAPCGGDDPDDLDPGVSEPDASSSGGASGDGTGSSGGEGTGPAPTSGGEGTGAASGGEGTSAASSGGSGGGEATTQGAGEAAEGCACRGAGAAEGFFGLLLLAFVRRGRPCTSSTRK